MNGASGRLFWKEYRRMRGFWIILALAGVMIQTLTLVYSAPDVAFAHIAGLVIAIATASFYALGCAATAFAGEHEEGSFDRLRILSPSPFSLGSAYVAFVFVSSLALAGALVLTTWAMLPGPLATVDWGLFAGWGVFGLELLAWGLFFSIWTTRPLNAVCLAAATSLCIGVVLTLFGQQGYDSPWTYRGVLRGELPFQEIFMGVATILRLIVALVVLVVDAALIPRWIHGPLWSWRPAHHAERSTGRARQVSRTSWFRPVGRLVWLEFWQAAPRIRVFAIVAAVIFLCAYSIRDSNFERTLAPILATVMGVSVFAAEQEQQRFRFLAQHAAAARTVWFAKHVVWIPAVIVIAGGFAAAMRVEEDSPIAPSALSLLVVGYACGQLCSMLIPRTVTAALVACTIVLIPSFLWTVFLFESQSLAWTWSALPLIWLGITWWYAPAWLLERQSWVVRGRLAAVFVLSIALLVTSASAYYVLRIPSVEFPAELAQPAAAGDPKSLEVGQRYMEALRAYIHRDLGQLVPEAREATADSDGKTNFHPKVQNWIDLNQNAIDLALAAGSTDTIVIPKDFDSDPLGIATYGIQELLRLRARQLENASDLDGALEIYLAQLRLAKREVFGTSSLISSLNSLVQWGARPGQTADRLRRAAHAVSELDWNRSDAVRELAREWAQMSRTNWYTEKLNRLPREYPLVRTVLQWVYWPGSLREQRIQRLWVRAALQQIDYVERKQQEHQPINQQEFERTGNLAVVDVLKASPSHETWNPFAWARAQLAAQSRIRMTRLVLALQAYYLETGELPESLDAIVGKTIDALPVDPYSAGSFAYSKSYQYPTTIQRPNAKGEVEEDPVLNKPVVWTNGFMESRYVSLVRPAGAGVHWIVIPLPPRSEPPK